MELYLELDEEPTESLWVVTKEQTNMGDIVVGICCRPPDQEEQMDEAFYGQLEAASHSWALVPVGDFNHPDIYWRDNRAGHGNIGGSWRASMTAIQVIEEPMRRGVLLDRILTSKEGLVGNVKVKESLGCSDHKMVEFRITRRNRAKKQDCKLRLWLQGSSSGICLEEFHGNKALEGTGVQESWLIFKEHHLRAKEQFIQTSRKSSKDARRPAWMEE